MKAEWLVYALVVSVLVTLAAYAIEAVLRLLGRPARGAWAGAMFGSLVLPAVLPLLPRPAVTPPAFMPPTFSLNLGEVGSAAGAAPFWTPETILMAGWLTASVALLLFGAVSLARLA